MRTFSLREFHPGFTLCLLLCVVAAAGAAGEVQRQFMARGSAKLQAQDFKGAIAEFTLAIVARPEEGEAYLWRGYARHSNHDLPGALADYTKAIDLARVTLGGNEWHPGLAGMYLNRGKAQQDGEKWDEALSDYTNALKCDANLAAAYVSRGFIRQMKGDPAGAIADYDEMLKRDPRFVPAVRLRGLARQLLADWRGAADDFQAMISLDPANASYAHFFLWISHAHLGEQPAGGAELAAHFGRRLGAGGDDWEAAIATFLLGRMKEADFLQAATSPDVEVAKSRRCEAWYYSGAKRLLAKDRSGAAECFRKCVAVGRKDFVEHNLATNELKLLE